MRIEINTKKKSKKLRIVLIVGGNFGVALRLLWAILQTNYSKKYQNANAYITATNSSYFNQYTDTYSDVYLTPNVHSETYSDISTGYCMCLFREYA